MLIGDIATNNARRYPDKRALVDADRALTWSQVDERARRLASFLIGRGLAPGDRVMVIARNCLEWPEISFGLAKAGLITVPVNIRLAPDEVAHSNVLNNLGYGIIDLGTFTEPVHIGDPTWDVGEWTATGSPGAPPVW